MEIRSLATAEAFTTKDGSTIREILGPLTAPVLAQSLAEASLPPGGKTQRHYHAESEELYFLLEGTGTMEVDGAEAEVGPDDGILIPAGAWHQIRAHGEPLRFLCCCAPPYRHDDTFFE